jgi:ribosomal-protein-alanine N-acetyltransferase
VELLTPRLRLRPFVAADVSGHLALYGDPEVTRLLPGGPFDAAEAAARSARALDRFARHAEAHGFTVSAVTDRATGRLLGQCGLLHLPDGPDVEILYALERVTWGQGLATEAAGAVLGHAFGPLGLPRVVAVARAEHLASRRVMEKLGMRQEADREVFGSRAVCYAVSREAFRGVMPAAPSPDRAGPGSPSLPRDRRAGG